MNIEVFMLSLIFLTFLPLEKLVSLYDIILFFYDPFLFESQNNDKHIEIGLTYLIILPRH